MNNRLIKTIQDAKKNHQKLFCGYITFGFPFLSATQRIVPILEQAGMDILELGFPFSDPLADGPTIQSASEQALKNGATMKGAMSTIKKLRRGGLRMPVILFSYLNPILHYGIERIAKDLKISGFDGLIIPDLSMEEGRSIEPIFRRNNLSLVYLIAPTTPKKRMAEIAKRSSGFIYYVSVRGVTGTRRQIPADLFRNVRTIKQMTDKPVLVGFGVSEAAQAKEISKCADGIIVGSALIKLIAKTSNHSVKLFRFVHRLANAIRLVAGGRRR